MLVGLYDDELGLAFPHGWEDSVRESESSAFRICEWNEIVIQCMYLWVGITLLDGWMYVSNHIDTHTGTHTHILKMVEKVVSL